MLTTIKEALASERSFDSVSNKINSTIVRYSDMEDLENENKAFTNPNFEDLKGDVNFITKTATEAFALLSNMNDVVVPSLNKITSMKSSFSTEGAFEDFIKIAWEKFKNIINSFIEKLCEIYGAIAKFFIGVKNIILKFICSKYDVGSKAVKNLKPLLTGKYKDMLMSEFLMQLDDDALDHNLDFPENNNPIDVNNPRLESLFTDARMYISKHVSDGKNYSKRLVDRCKILKESFFEINDVANGLLKDISNGPDSVEYSTIVNLSNQTLKPMVDKFFNSFKSEDLNPWVARAYGITVGKVGYEKLRCDQSEEMTYVSDITYGSQSTHSYDIYKQKTNNYSGEILPSISSPLRTTLIESSIGAMTVEKPVPTGYNSIFGMMTCKEVYDFLDKFAIDMTVAVDNLALKDNGFEDMCETMRLISDKCSKSLKTFGTKLKEVKAVDSATSGVARTCIQITMLLFSDMCNAAVAARSVISGDILNRCKCQIDMTNVIFSITKQLSEKCNKRGAVK